MEDKEDQQAPPSMQEYDNNDPTILGTISNNPMMKSKKTHAKSINSLADVYLDSLFMK